MPSAQHIRCRMGRSTLPIVAVQTFIAATRDTGYKSTGAAIAELIDNAFEAHAYNVDITINATNSDASRIVVRVVDNGTGMPPDVLRLALQFGGSTRFASRTSMGRYGMGLPNGSLSQARRVDVYTWQGPGQVWTTHLDVDEVLAGRVLTLPAPRPTDAPRNHPGTSSGTIVVLSKCDRLDSRNIDTLIAGLSLELGRVFRKFLCTGRRIRINGEAIRPIDPLFISGAHNSAGAAVYGPPLEYRVRTVLPSGPSESLVTVRFSELPLAKWHSLSNEQKNALGIAKRAGVSVLRAGREIDYGWYFMGTKRKENYDDWWRCEVEFSPELDELFGVTHSKQKINPTEAINCVLVPDMERIARDLNSRIRRNYAEIRGLSSPSDKLVRRLEARDHLLEPPARGANSRRNNQHDSPLALRQRNSGIAGLRFSVTHEASADRSFYATALMGGTLQVMLNESHPFFGRVYRQIGAHCSSAVRAMAELALLIVIASARAESTFECQRDREIMARFRKIWSDTIATFLC